MDSVVSEKLFKVIIIGDPTVGKTSFVQRYIQNSYKKDYKGTVGVDFALKLVKWSDAKTVKLQLWDIAGKIYTMYVAPSPPMTYVLEVSYIVANCTEWVIIPSEILVDYKNKMVKYTTVKLMLFERAHSKVFAIVENEPQLFYS